MCSPELSDFETSIWQAFEQDSVVVVGITAVNQNQINEFVSANGITYPILNDQQSNSGNGPGGFGGVTYDEYYIPTQGSPYPRDFIVSQDGAIVYANNEIDTEQMIYIIEDLLDQESLYVYENSSNTPNRIKLLSVFPNPFNPVANIQFFVRPFATKNYTISIYNNTGQLVEKINNKEFVLGYNTIQWNAGSHPSGIYFTRLESDNNFLTQKIIFLK